MPYIHGPTKTFPVSARDVESTFPNTSFPRDAAARDVAFADRGYHRVEDASAPEFDSATHRLLRHTAPTLNDGVWSLGWDVIPLTQEEISSNLTAWRENTSVTPRQMRQALLKVGLLDDIEAMMPNLPRKVRIDWEYSILMERNNPQWDKLGAGMTPPKTPEDIDDIFRLAQSET